MFSPPRIVPSILMGDIFHVLHKTSGFQVFAELRQYNSNF